MAEHQHIDTNPVGSSSGHVKPRIQEIERRMQLRSPEHRSDDNDHPRQRRPAPASSARAPSTPSSNGNTISQDIDRNNDKENNASAALVLHRSPILSSFIPNSNKKIKQFESDVLKRQAEYTARISDLEGRLASFHTRLAVECAERGREHSFTVDEYVNGPLEQAMKRSLERIENDFIRPIMDPLKATAPHTLNSGEKQSPLEKKGDGKVENGDAQNESKDMDNDDGTTTARTLPNLVAIERRTNLLEAHMNHHKHVVLFNSRRQNFDAIDKACRQTVQPALALEMTKADKRETGMSRRFDSSSGEFTRLTAEMTSSRVSSLGYIEKEIDDWDLSDMMRAEHYLEEIQKLKQMVIREREERMRRDLVVAETIVKTNKMLEVEVADVCRF